MTDRCIPFWPSDPRELVPGDTDAVESLARDLLLLARDAAQAGTAMAGVDAAGWEGTAAEEFRELLRELPDRLAVAEEAFRAAGAALYQHVEVVAAARSTARRALELFESGNARTRAWLSDRARLEAATSTYGPYVPGSLPVVSPDDPGEPERREAQRRLQSALDEVERSGDRAAARLRRAADEAPRGSRLRDRVLSGMELAARSPVEYYRGVGEAAWETGTFVVKMSPTYAMLNPRGAMQDRMDLGLGVVYAAQHPLQAGSGMLDLELLKENPARWAGSFSFDAALATATAGGSGAVAVGSRTGRVATRLGALAIHAGVSPRLVALAGRRIVPPSPIDPMLQTRDVIGAAEELADRHRAAELGRLSRGRRAAPAPGSGSW
jgi:hypothetical protein